MKIAFYKALLISFLITSIEGCYYDNEEELYPGKVDCVLENITYTNTILPIIRDNCYTCHAATNNQGGGYVLEGYDQFIIWVNSGAVVSAVESGRMPKTGNRLLDCEVEKIKKWVADGALNN